MQKEMETRIAFKCYKPSNTFLTWIQYKHYPIVSLEQEDSFERRLSQIEYNSTSYGKWWIPINLSTNNLKQIIQNFTTCLTPDSPSFTVQQIDGTFVWIVNIQRAGYYRVKYDLKGWHAIANYLNSTAGEYKEISVINRAKIIDDAFHLMMERQLNVSVFWNLTQFLSQETNYIVWYPMFKVFEYMSNIFPYSKNEIKYIHIIKEKLRKMLDPLIIPMLQKNQTGFNRCLRQEILKWACVLEHHTCTNAAFQALDIHFMNPEIHPILPEWKHWTFCRGLILCHYFNYSVWFNATSTWLKKPDYNLLPFLTCCQSNSIITEHLPNLFWKRFDAKNERKDITVIRSYINIFHSIIAKHANTYNTLTEILLNLEEIKPKAMKTLTALTDIINHVYSSQILGQIIAELNKVYHISGFHLQSIQHKIQTRLSEINRHVEHFQFINFP